MPAEDAATPTPASGRRRRGAVLENALLDAAFEEVMAKGYDAFTIEAVAERAETSRAVVYRRWPSKPELVAAAILHRGRQQPVRTPDTGSLRSDLITLLRQANRARAQLGILLSARLGAYFIETGQSFADLREVFLSGRESSVDVVFDHAIERGEVDPAKATPRVRGLAFDLYRHEVLMTFRPVPGEVITSIVDEIVLPLVTQ
ncbi:TetR/AcrR family transcriptional regulator [Flexivirga caeni]|uniref:TetR/AcrR family transcriptional regulator n=1 Tax=Flexivirga caeni TaxID=2294115 RepID=A0A3M9M913_9MICO|nr:TetR/AcrR family transcriptional regulator [Flexivirga caeni]RNI21715.1 TetR/AcrR family transcriptional regulator [Flexivirga caeni]